jgi:hypothetical protein
MEAVRSSEKLVKFYRNQQCHTAEDISQAEGSSFGFSHYDTACFNVLHCNQDQLSQFDISHLNRYFEINIGSFKEVTHYCFV